MESNLLSGDVVVVSESVSLLSLWNSLIIHEENTNEIMIVKIQNHADLYKLHFEIVEEYECSHQDVSPIQHGRTCCRVVIKHFVLNCFLA